MSTKNRIQLVVAYDGTDFCGWAAQTGRRTVQSTLTDAVRQISGEDCEIIGASRTDSGTHAKGQVCHFDTVNPMPAQNWVRALNDAMPSDLAIVLSRRVQPDFHSRFSAIDRKYRYTFQVGPRNPLKARYGYVIHAYPDVEKMHRAAQALVGSHDFWSYSEETPLEVNSIRVVHSISVKQVKDEVWLEVTGNAFMRGMMRRIAGALLNVGQGRLDPQWIQSYLDPKLRAQQERPPVLPAKGLCLLKIRYGRHPKDFRLNTTIDQNEREEYE